MAKLGAYQDDEEESNTDAENADTFSLIVKIHLSHKYLNQDQMFIMIWR